MICNHKKCNNLNSSYLSHSDYRSLRLNKYILTSAEGQDGPSQEQVGGSRAEYLSTLLTESYSCSDSNRRTSVVGVLFKTYIGLFGRNVDSVYPVGAALLLLLYDVSSQRFASI